MAFFKEDAATPADDSKSLNQAKQLCSILAKNRRLTKRPNLGKWAAQIDTLSEFFTQEEIDLTLNWLSSHIRDLRSLYLPGCWSADSFCTHFARYYDAAADSMESVDFDLVEGPGVHQSPRAFGADLFSLSLIHI